MFDISWFYVQLLNTIIVEKENSQDNKTCPVNIQKCIKREEEESTLEQIDVQWKRRRKTKDKVSLGPFFSPFCLKHAFK